MGAAVCARATSAATTGGGGSAFGGVTGRAGRGAGGATGTWRVIVRAGMTTRVTVRAGVLMVLVVKEGAALAAAGARAALARSPATKSPNPALTMPPRPGTPIAMPGEKTLVAHTLIVVATPWAAAVRSGRSRQRRQFLVTRKATGGGFEGRRGHDAQQQTMGRPGAGRFSRDSPVTQRAPARIAQQIQTGAGEPTRRRG